MLRIRRVVGPSMEPALYAGDIVIARKKDPKPTDVVIARIDSREVIKRVLHRSPTHLYLVGDNPAASTDSRQYGEIPLDSIMGVVIKTFRATSSRAK